MQIKQRPWESSWWRWLIGINFVLVFASAYQHTFPLNVLLERIFRQFDLGEEMNFAAWWSAMLLLAIALVCYEIYSAKQQQKLPWLLIAIAFTLLSMDELGSLHERIESWIILIDRHIPLPLAQTIDPYVPIIIVGGILLPLPLIILWKFSGTRTSAIWLTIGLVLLATISVQERMEGYFDWGSWGGLRLGVEEGTELLGMCCCYWGVVLQRVFLLGDRTSRDIPNPQRIKGLQKLIFIGLIFHLGFSVFESVFWELEYSGRSLVWYPAAIFLVICLTAYWQYKSIQPQSKGWFVCGINSLLASAITPYLIYPSISPQLPAIVEPNFYYILGLELIAAVVIYKLIYPKISQSAFIVICLSAIVLGIGYAIPGETVRSAIAGIFSYLVAVLLLFNLFQPKNKALKVGKG